MPVTKKRNESTETRLLLEGGEPVALPPAEIEERAVIVQFEQYKPFVPELMETLRAGTVAEPVPVMMDGSTFAVHTATRTFWVKLWHAANSDLQRIERAQVISCLPSTRGVQVVVGDPELEDDDDDDDTEWPAEDEAQESDGARSGEQSPYQEH